MCTKVVMLRFLLEWKKDSRTTIVLTQGESIIHSYIYFNSNPFSRVILGLESVVTSLTTVSYGKVILNYVID